MKTYKSKIDWWFGILFLYPIFLGITSIVEGKWIGFIYFSFIIGVIIFISKTTNYRIEGNELTVKCLWIINDRIEISKIRKIEKSNSILSSPALSLDRIAVYYNKYDEVYISPKEKQAFIDALLEINPTVEVKI